MFFFLASAADAAPVNPNGTNTLFANGAGTFFINGKPTFFNGRRSLPRNPPDCIIFNTSAFDHFSLADELFTKAFRLKICLLVNNNLYRKLISLVLIIFDDNLKVTSFALFVTDDF